MTRAHRLAVITLGALALAACGDGSEGSAAANMGEVLPGSTTDAMLPLDTVRSQPPLAPSASGTAKGAAKEDRKASGGRAARAAAAENTPAVVDESPAATPSAE